MATMDIANPSEEHLMLREMVREWTQEYVEPQALEYDREEKFNHELLRSMGELGLLGISAPEEYGGAGLDAVACTIVHEELSASDPGFALAYLAHSMLFVNNLAYNGTEEQKQRILPKVCSGEWIGAMAMSEPDAGTDVLGLSTSAVQREDGVWVLNGRKMWITNGCIDEDGTPADVVWVYAKTGEDERGRVQMSTFLVEAGMQGYSVGQKIYDKTGMRASNTAELVFDDCLVPAENLVGGVGESLIHMMGNLELERLTLAGMALGIGRRALDEMNRYATDRTAFGSPIRDFGQIQRYIGESWAKYRAMRAYIYDTANNLTIGTAGQRLDSDGVKLFATTAAKEIADAAMQVMGGYGYVGEYHVERLWRDAKLLEIGGGTLESHQKNITRDLFKDVEAVNR
jgi:isovaleryl-CoA dehydrogenase|tara:strand:+ start:1128 stop:2330 length:1203 start_codon:yes stop_codon:yes gene_type:complete